MHCIKICVMIMLMMPIKEHSERRKKMEIERKYLIDFKKLPADYQTAPCREMEQGYLCTGPVVRIRKEDSVFYLTYKSPGLLQREEYNLPLTRDAYEHLLPKCDGNIISKTRYRIPFGTYTIELDIFHGLFKGLLLAEVEFPSVEEADAFVPPEWFGEDVTFSSKYHNSSMSEADVSTIRQNYGNFKNTDI